MPFTTLIDTAAKIASFVVYGSRSLRFPLVLVDLQLSIAFRESIWLAEVIRATRNLYKICRQLFAQLEQTSEQSASTRRSTLA